MKQISSEIIGSLLPALEPQNGRGPEHGTTGALTSFQDAAVARDWLLRQDSPAATDKAVLHSLESSLNVTVGLEEQWRFPKDAKPYKVSTGCTVSALDGANIPAAIEKVKASLTKPEIRQAEEWLAMLHAACAKATDDDAGTAIAFTLYASTLAQFPADVAKAACVTVALRKTSGPNWFPTLSELNTECERLTSPRLAMLSGLMYGRRK